MIVVDASILIAHFQSNDIHHEQAEALLHANLSANLNVHPMNLAESLVGAVRVGRAPTMLKVVVDIGIRVLSSDEGEPLRLATLRVTTGLRLPDCCVLDSAQRNSARLATFNDKLADAARKSGIVVVR